MFRAQLTVGDANFDLYITFVKMLDEHVRLTMLLKKKRLPFLTCREAAPGHLLKDFALLSLLYPLCRWADTKSGRGMLEQYSRTDTRVKRKKERRGKTVPLSDEEEVVFQPVQPPRLLITLRFLRFIYFHCETFVFHFYEPNHFSEKLRVPSLSHLVEGREFVGKSFSGPSRKLGNGMI